MSLYDIATSLIAAFLVIRELMACTLNQKVKVKGKTSGRFIADIILLILVCALVLIKRSSFNYPYLPPCLMAVFVIVSFIPKSGMGDDGFVSNGRFVAFSEIEFYAIDYEDEKGFRLRLHTLVREYVLFFDSEKKDGVTAALDAKNVKQATFEAGKNKNDD